MTAAAPRSFPMSADSDVVLEATDLSRTFVMGQSKLEILRGVSVSIARGEFVAIEGRSGSGKSTLMHLMGLLDEPDKGRVIVNGVDSAGMTAAERCAVRNTQVGFVFQFYHLLPELDVMQNTLLAAMVGRSTIAFSRGRKATRERAERTLAAMGLGDRMHHRPSQLSGGERQRVAIARALMNEPKILLADEPTGNLDFETGRQIMGVLESLHAQGQTIVMVTHDRSIARRADRVLVLKKGVLVANDEAGEL